MNCGECESSFPILEGSNNDAWMLWTLCDTQWRMAFGGAVGLDYTAIFEVARVMMITVTPSVFNKIRLLEHLQLEKMNKKPQNRSKGGIPDEQ